MSRIDHCFNVFSSKSKAFHEIIFQEKYFTITFCKPCKLFVNLWTFFSVPKVYNGFNWKFECITLPKVNLQISYLLIFPIIITCEVFRALSIIDLSFLLKVGVALGFVLPPILVPNDDNKSQNMLNMFLGMACITTVLLVLIFAGKLIYSCFN